MAEDRNLQGLPLFADAPATSDSTATGGGEWVVEAAQPHSNGTSHTNGTVHRMPGSDHGATETGGRRRREGIGLGENVDWALVRAFRQQAADQLTNATVDREGIDEDTRRELGRKIILDLLSEQARASDFSGHGGYSPAEQQQLAEAIFASLFGLGRLQPLVDDEGVENIEIRGHDDVLLVYSDGRIVKGPAVADSNEELVEFLQFLAARSGGAERPFSPSEPNLDLKLPGDHRLAATNWISPMPYVVIRRHRLVDVDLDDLVAKDMLDPGLASFLRAAVRAKKSIVVSGPQGAGKTTLVRALCNEIAPWEAIGTIETEYELLLHELKDRHPRCFAFEARPGSGERGGDGRRLGEVNLDEILRRMLRMNLSRIIVGEVRGLEVLPMFEAMQAGAGSLSTTHAYAARAAIQRLAGLALKGGSHLKEYALTEIAEHIDLIVQIRLQDTTTDHGNADSGDVVGVRERFVSEVIALRPGDDGHPAVTDVYKPGANGRAVAHLIENDFAEELRRYGFNDAEFRGRVITE